MTQKFYITVFFLSILAFGQTLQAQTTYSITANSNWSAKLPATCYACTINISTGITLTIDEDVTCQNCFISGGNLTMTNQTLNIQYAGSSVVTTKFTGTNFTIYGDNAKVIVNAPLAMTSSTFTFNNASYFNTSYQVDLQASRINLYDNSTMYSTGGSSTTINLKGSSMIVVGSGSQTSKAMLTVSGPTVNVYDQSTITLGNENNVYYNWSSYNGASSAASAKTSYSTSNSTMNCGGTHANACASPYLYGPSTLTKQGTVSGSTLPVVLVGFSAMVNTNNTVLLNWSTKIEENASHFEIERSADGSSWTAVGSVQAEGNTTSGAEYSYTDQTPLAGVNYYRLKMVDLDNRYGYTAVKVLRIGTVASISFFPNPARDYVNISLADGSGSGSQLNVRLISQSGQIIQERTTAAGNGTVVTFPLQNVAPGFYIISVTGTDGTRQTSKLIVSKS